MSSLLLLLVPFLASPAISFTASTAGEVAAGAAAAAAAEGVAQPRPKKPALAGVPGDSGAVAVAATGQALASAVDKVSETRRSSSPACLVAVSAASSFVVLAFGLGVQQFLTHVSQTRFGAV